MLRAKPYISEYICRSTGIQSSRLRLYPEKFLAIPVIRPSINEQLEIVRAVEEGTKQFDIAIERAQQQIDLLREYRARLIADVVTGKLDVRAAAGGLAEVDEAEVGLEDETDGDAEDAADEPLAPEPDAD